MRQRSLGDRVLEGFCLAAVVVPLLLVALLLVALTFQAWPRLTSGVLWGAQLGILSALGSTVALALVATIVAVPVAIGTAIYLVEYRDSGPLPGLIEVNLGYLASVPGVVYGLLGLEIFVRGVGLGYGIIVAGLTLAAMLIPSTTMMARDALRAVPTELREASLSLGATRGQVVAHLVLPSVLPRLFANGVAAFSRALGATAPLIVLGTTFYASASPADFSDGFVALAPKIFLWLADPGAGSSADAAAAVMVLLVTVLSLNYLPASRSPSKPVE